MIKWQIKFDEIAKKELSKLSHQQQSLIRNYLYIRIISLEHPKLIGKALSANKKGYWRYRVDKFRIICKIEEDKLTILIVKIAKLKSELSRHNDLSHGFTTYEWSSCKDGAVRDI